MDFKILDTFQPVLWGLDGGSALEGSIDGSAEFLKVIFASNYLRYQATSFLGSHPLSQSSSVTLFSSCNKFKLLLACGTLCTFVSPALSVAEKLLRWRFACRKHWASLSLGEVREAG